MILLVLLTRPLSNKNPKKLKNLTKKLRQRLFKNQIKNKVRKNKLKNKNVNNKRDKIISKCLLKMRNLNSSNTATGKNNGKKSFKKKWLSSLMKESRH